MNKLEKNSPELRELAKELKMEIYYRGGEYWADGPMEIQLTYKIKINKDGARQDVSSLSKRIETAIDRLKLVKKARQQPGWGTKRERYERVLKGIKVEGISKYRRDTFTTWNHTSLDHACLLAREYRREYTIWVKLVREKEIEVTGKSWEDCLEQLWNKIDNYTGE
jgi:hypothetical protein